MAIAMVADMVGQLGLAVTIVGFASLVFGSVIYASALRRTKSFDACVEAESVQRSRAEAFKAQSEERGAALTRLTTRVGELEELLIREKEKKDTAPILERLVEQGELMAGNQAAIMQSFSRHEARAIERHEATVNALTAIADSLNGREQ